jgi:hypothetical protein
MDEEELTLQDLINMGYNIEALEEWFQGVYTKEELKQILNNELDIMYLGNNKLPEYTDNQLIPNYKKKESFMKKLTHKL